MTPHFAKINLQWIDKLFEHMQMDVMYTPEDRNGNGIYTHLVLKNVKTTYTWIIKMRT